MGSMENTTPAPAKKVSRIAKLIEEIDSNTKIANRVVDEYHFSVRAAHQNAIREAKDKLVGLRREYSDLISAGAAAIFLRGDVAAVKEFASHAEGSGNVVPVDAGGFWDRLASLVEPSLGHRREFSVTQLRLVENTLTEIADQVGYQMSGKHLSQTEIPYLGSTAEVREYVRSVVRGSIGDDLFRGYVMDQIVKQAVARQHATPTIIALVTGADERDQEALTTKFARGTTSLVTTFSKLEDVDYQELVRDAIKHLRK